MLLLKIENYIINIIIQYLENKNELFDSNDINILKEKLFLTTPKSAENGDLSTNFAMILCSKLHKNPKIVAQDIVTLFNKNKYFRKIEIVGNGFINFFYNDNILYDELKNINQIGENYSRDILDNQEHKVLIEFVSANPTGPLHIGHGRGAVIGDVLYNLYTYTGYAASKEYYVNDAGNQINILGNSVKHYLYKFLGKESPFPEDGYQGEYIKELAQEYFNKNINFSDKINNTDLFEWTYNKILDDIKSTLLGFNIDFDTYFFESTLHKNDTIPNMINNLEKQHYVYKKNDAVWFKSSEFNDNKDRVIIKSDGSYTYFAADIAYHKNKIDRNFNVLINVLGADHHGYISRLEAAINVLSNSKVKFYPILYQLVSIKRQGEKVRLSTRKGNFITLKEILDEIGSDAARYFFISRTANSQLEIDVDLAVEQSDKNPVYYIQYAYARINSIIRKSNLDISTVDNIDYSLLTNEKEINLIKMLIRLPLIMRDCIKRNDPSLLPTYILEIARGFHSFYKTNKVNIDENPELSKARTGLILAVKYVIYIVLNRIMGINTPERM